MKGLILFLNQVLVLVVGRASAKVLGFVVGRASAKVLGFVVGRASAKVLGLVVGRASAKVLGLVVGRASARHGRCKSTQRTAQRTAIFDDGCRSFPLKKVRYLRWFGVAVLLPAVTAHAFEVTDDRGISVSFVQPPQRIVSLLPSLTETVCELGACARLVGVDRYSDFPASVKQLPQVGGGLDPNIEAIVALKPDVVLMATSSRAGERLRALGLKVLALEPKTHADVKRVLGKVGQVLGVRDAARVWRVIDAAMQAAAQSLPQSIGNTRVYFEVNPGPYGAGESSFIGETLTRLGVKNIIPAKLGPFPKLNPEFIVRANPDVIMIGQRSLESMGQRPGWAGMRAMREQRLCVFTTAQSDTLVRPGPRMAEGARLMAQCLADKAGARRFQPTAGQVSGVATSHFYEGWGFACGSGQISTS